jgi:nudix-type nucleoside diphosphatase (YffH/AdpP family)
VRVKKVVIESKRRIFDDFFKIEEAFARYEKFNGQMSPLVRRLNFERGDSVAAVIFNHDTRRVILSNQFRYPTYAKGPGWIFEVVAGMIDQGEKPTQAMRREILEEIGYRVSRLIHIATFYVSPGGTSERIILYYAEVGCKSKVVKGGGLASEGEDIQRLEFPLAKIWRMVDTGKIVDAKTLIGLLWLKNHLKERK